MSTSLDHEEGLLSAESPLDRLFQLTMYHPVKEDVIFAESALIRDVLFVLEGSATLTKFCTLSNEDGDPAKTHEYKVRKISFSYFVSPKIFWRGTEKPAHCISRASLLLVELLPL